MEKYMELTTTHEQISEEEAERCRELIEQLPEENDCKSPENHIK